MASVRSGQPPAWPWLLIGGMQRHPAVKGGRRSFRRKRQAPLRVEGTPDTERAIPAPGFATALHLPLACLLVDQVTIIRRGQLRLFLSTRCIVLSSDFADKGEKGGVEHVRAV
jgi:hypothetical protein